MDIYTRFNLPPPPPPTMFSRDHTVARARMPNFNSVDEIATFLDDINLPRYSTSATDFTIFAIAFAVVLLTTLSLFILQRIYNKTWWVFRLIPRGHSKILIPNVHTSWVVYMAIYGWVRVAFYAANYIAHVRHEPIPNRILWASMMWSPIAFACWYQTWAITAARGTSGSSSSNNVPSRSSSRPIPSWLVNIVFLCLPLGPAIAALVPGVIGNRSDEHARHGWYEWHSKYDGKTEMTRDMLLDAQNIFHQTLEGVYFLSIALTIWMIVCVLCGGAYAFASCSLILDLRKHVASKLPRTSRTFTRTPCNLSFPASRIEAPPRCMQRGECIEKQMSSIDKDEITTTGSWIDEGHQRPIGSSAFADEAQNRPVSFLPAVPLLAKLRSFTRGENLRAYQVLLTFIIQSASVVLGCVIFIVLLLVAVARFYPDAERGHFGHIFKATGMAATIASLIAGTTSTIAVTHTTFEASFSILLHAWRNEKRNQSKDTAQSFDEMGGREDKGCSAPSPSSPP